MDNKSTNRDILIKLSTEIEYIKDRVNSLYQSYHENGKNVNDLRDRIIVLEERTEENTGLRKRVNGALLSGLISLATVIGILVSIITKGM